MSPRAEAMLAARSLRRVSLRCAAESSGLERAFYLCSAHEAEARMVAHARCLLSPQPTL